MKKALGKLGAKRSAAVLASGLLIGGLGIGGRVLRAAEKQKREEPRVQVRVEQVLTGSEGLSFTLVPEVREGLKLNLDAPWQLTLGECTGIVVAEKVYKKKSFDPETGKISVRGTRSGGEKKSGKKNEKSAHFCAFTLVAFTCTRDQKQCFREVITSEMRTAD
jgi:hypothetical protein